jgi:hypothetical protein
LLGAMSKSLLWVDTQVRGDDARGIRKSRQ